MPQDITKNEVNIGEVIYQWTVLEYERHDRDRRWYLVMGIIGAVLVAYAIMAANYLFAMIIVLFAIITFMHDMVEPMEIPFFVTNTGIVLGKKYYRYSELESFWIIYDPPAVKNLYFTLNSAIKHRLQVPLEDNDPRPISDYLNQFLEEDLEKEEEPLSDRYSRLFKL